MMPNMDCLHMSSNRCATASIPNEESQGFHASKLPMTIHYKLQKLQEFSDNSQIWRVKILTVQSFSLVVILIFDYIKASLLSNSIFLNILRNSEYLYKIHKFKHSQESQVFLKIHNISPERLTTYIFHEYSYDSYSTSSIGWEYSWDFIYFKIPSIVLFL